MLPSLAVAAALRERGVTVTFAGSPDRVEARLVPEAGYELDTFEISGFPRRPSVALAALADPGAAGASRLRGDPRAPPAARRPRRRRLRRRADGARGLAARMPAALTEADAHLGLANRLAAPFARRVFLAYTIPGRDGAKYRVTGRPVPREHRGVSQAEGRRRFGLPERGPVLAFFGALAGARSLNDFAVETYGDGGPGGAARLGRARLRAAARPRCTATTTCSSRRRTSSAPRSRRADLAISRAGGHGLGARRRRDARRPRSVSARDRRPPDAERAVLRARRRRGRRPGARARPRARRSSTSCSPIPTRLAAMRAAMLAMARPHAADEIAEELIALARSTGRRLWFVGIGGAGLSSYAFLARAWGAEVGGWDRVETPYLRALERRRGGDRRRSRSSRTAGRWSSRARTRPSRGRRAPSSSPSSSRSGARSSSPARTARRRRPR